MHKEQRLQANSQPCIQTKQTTKTTKQASKQTNKQTNKRTNEQTNTQTRNGRINATLHVKSFCSGQMNANKLAQQ
jgi:hypothetical protein